MFENLERYNFYKYENKLKEEEEDLLQYIDEILEEEGLETVINVLKSSGLAVNIFSNRKHEELFNNIYEKIISKIKNEESPVIQKFLKEVELLEELFISFNKQRDDFFNSYEITDEYKVVSYLITLELYMSNLQNEETSQQVVSGDASAESLVNMFEHAIESTGMILKYFMFKGYGFKGSNRNISPKNLQISSFHILFSEMQYVLNDALEYWKYSDVEVKSNDQGKVEINFIDEDFELNNLISNERFNVLRISRQMQELQKELRENNGQLRKGVKSEILENLAITFSTLYFGSPLLEEKVKGIQLKKWLFAYGLLIGEAKKFKKRKQNLKVYNLEKICLSKSIHEWGRFFQRNGFTNTESQTLIEIFTFDRKTDDLVDSPFVKIDNNLIIIPSLTAQADSSRGLASNFLNRKFNLDFRGPGFEERIKELLTSNNIKNSSLYTRTDGTEYECDIAFILDDELFLVECKAHVQPYTTRQHANHLYKLHEATLQLKRIAEFYEENTLVVNEQLGIKGSFTPKKINRILMTTSMIGDSMFTNETFLIDESSFTSFINRIPPTWHYNKMEAHSGITYMDRISNKFDIYEDDVTAKKMIQFLNSPPQIEITRNFFQKKNRSFNLFDINSYIKIVDNFQIGGKIGPEKQNIMKNFF